MIANYLLQNKTLDILKRDKASELNFSQLVVHFAENMKLILLEKNEILFRLDDIGENFYVIIKGRVAVLKPKKKKYTLTQLGFLSKLREMFKNNETYLLNHTIKNNYELYSFQNYDHFIKYESILIKIDFALAFFGYDITRKNKDHVEKDNFFSNNQYSTDRELYISEENRHFGNNVSNLDITNATKQENTKTLLNKNTIKLLQFYREEILLENYKDDKNAFSNSNPFFGNRTSCEINNLNNNQNISMPNKTLDSYGKGNYIPANKFYDNSDIGAFSANRGRYSEYHLDKNKDAYNSNNYFHNANYINNNVQNLQLRNTESNIPPIFGALNINSNNAINTNYNNNSINNNYHNHTSSADANTRLENFIEKFNYFYDSDITVDKINSLTQDKIQLFFKNLGKIPNIINLDLKELNFNDKAGMFLALMEKLILSQEEEEIYAKYSQVFSDNQEHKQFAIFEYEEFINLKTGDFFGDFALDSDKRRRTATIMATEKCYLGFLANEVYHKYIFQEKNKIRQKDAQLLNSISLFYPIKSYHFEKLYFADFAPHEFFKSEIILKQGDCYRKLLIVKEGQINLTYHGSMEDIEILMSKIIEQSQRLKLISTEEAKILLEIYCDGLRKNNKTQDYIKAVNSKKDHLLVTLGERQFCPLESILLEMNAFYRITSNSDKCKIFFLDKEKFDVIVNSYKEIKTEFIDLGIKKIKALLKRLYTIKSCYLDIYEQRSEAFIKYEISKILDLKKSKNGNNFNNPNNEAFECQESNSKKIFGDGNNNNNNKNFIRRKHGTNEALYKTQNYVKGISLFDASISANNLQSPIFSSKESVGEKNILLDVNNNPNKTYIRKNTHNNINPKKFNYIDDSTSLYKNNIDCNESRASLDNLRDYTRLNSNVLISPVRKQKKISCIFNFLLNKKRKKNIK